MIFQKIIVQNVYKIFGYIISMILLCWLGGIIFYFLIVYINKVDDQSGDCYNSDFLNYEFKGEGFCIRNQDLYQKTVLMVYYMSTTISTVGLGDYRPYSDFERLIIVPFFLFGLLIFSYMNNMMLEITFRVHEQLKDGQNLSQLTIFVTILRKRFNYNMPLSNNFED